MRKFVRPSWTGFGRAALLGALFALAVAPTDASAQTTADKYQNRRTQADALRARFSLHAEPSIVLDANQFQCGLVNTGDTCTDVFDSPTGGGGFWPTGSPNQYMFNSGIMIAGIIPEDAGFEWAGDTTGAYFFDARGTQQHGTPITNIYNSLNPDDIAEWPAAGDVPGFPTASAYITDADIFSDVLIGRAFGSQQDSWVMYWDGDPGLSANRDHPMGVTIEQRTMAWNFPSGNEATIFIFYKLTNVTNNSIFQSLNEGRYGFDLPDAGWRIDSIYMAYGADPDVTADATINYASVILPFNMGITYHGQFVATEFSYPPSLFYPPFFTNSPGIVGVQYLKSPEDPVTGEEVGLTMFSVHQNPGSCTGLCDPLGDKQLWRYISGNVNPGIGDPSCNIPNPRETRICFLPQVTSDARFFQASGPFSLNAGESATIVVAMMAGATVNTPEITVGSNNPPGIPSLRPGCGDEEILPIELGAGWVSTPVALCAETPDDQALDLRQITVVPNSLLGRAQVAQAVFDGKFLLPFAPEPPEFYLIPGDGEIAVIWDNSPTEVTGDPFFSAAQDESSPLFNPNFRQFDIEGYRIYRSTDNANFDLIAQFDYENTTFLDARCEADRTFVPGVDDCDPEGDGTADLDTVVLGINDETDVDHDFIIDPFVLFGGSSAQRLRLEDGRTLAIAGDSATPSPMFDLEDTGVPFAYIDTDVTNNFRYYYQVRAFDINSTFSGPISLESSSDTKSAIPRAAAPEQVLASFSQEMRGGDGAPLDPNAPMPALDADDGTFDGPMPPTNTLTATFSPLVPRLLPSFNLTATIDSVNMVRHALCTNGYGGGTTIPNAGCWEMFVSFDNNGTVTQSRTLAYTPLWDSFGDVGSATWLLGATQVAADEESLIEFGVDVDNFDLNFAAALQGQFDESIWNSSFEGQSNRAGRVGPVVAGGGSRWFAGENETVPDPTYSIRVGSLPGIDTIWSPDVHHTPTFTQPTGFANSGNMQWWGYTMAQIMRVADFEVTWNGGTITVQDVTHNVPVAFDPSPLGQTWAFVPDANDNGMIDDYDFFNLTGVADYIADNNAGADPATAEDGSSTPIVMPTSIQGVAPGSMTPGPDGFGLLLNAQRFIFRPTGGTLPADGTVWTLRMYHGLITSDNPTTADPSNYVFFGSGNVAGVATGILQYRPPLVPGLQMVFESTERTQLSGDSDLRLVHTVPDPYYAQSRYDLSPVEKALRFVNLPSQATIRIYTVSGLLVDVLNHNDPTGGGLTTWDLKNRSGQFVASGVYFFHVSTPDGDEHIGRFTVINSGIGQ